MKTVEQIKNEYAKEQGYESFEDFQINVMVEYDYINEHYGKIIQLVQDELKKYQAEQINMYKECLELFLPTDKWDEATLFLSTYGSGLAKDLSNKENIK